MVTSAHVMFNAFAKRLILTAKSCCTPSEKASIKKEFKLFDSSSGKYCERFANRVLRGESQFSDDRLNGDTQVLPGITAASLRANAPESDTQTVECSMRGMLVAAHLAQEEADEEMVVNIVRAIVGSSADKLHEIILDEDLLAAALALAAADLPSDVRTALEKVCAVVERGSISSAGAGDSGASESIGLIQLAQEISQGLDMSTLAGIAGQGGSDDAAMSSLFATINRTVMEKMQDGSLDPTRLCAEASCVLGANGNLSAKM